jgi:hypothetical protein
LLFFWLSFAEHLILVFLRCERKRKKLLYPQSWNTQQPFSFFFIYLLREAILRLPPTTCNIYGKQAEKSRAFRPTDVDSSTLGASERARALERSGLWGCAQCPLSFTGGYHSSYRNFAVDVSMAGEFRRQPRCLMRLHAAMTPLLI